MGGIEFGDAGLVALTVLWLIFIEGILSADNALVLAMMVRHLPRPEQKRALRYGIWGAFVFRVIAVFLAGILLDFWYLKLIGGGYLLYLAAQHFLSRDQHDSEEDGTTRAGKGFWSTVASVELADIAFSIDSILAAVALAEGLPPHIGENTKMGVVITGGVLGIITMRFVAGYFILLLERFPGLESAAYRLVAWIGLKLTLNGLHDGHLIGFEMDERLFWGGMLVFVLHGFLSQKKSSKSPEETAEFLQDMADAFNGEEEATPGATAPEESNPVSKAEQGDPAPR